MTLTNELRTMGVVQKVIDSEIDPSKPTYWSRHAWSFEGDGIVRLRLGKLAQNGREILFGSMTLGAVDALAGVPSFHPGITNEEAARLALAQERFTTYQRALIWERIPGIQAAWREADFAHTGVLTLHVPPRAHRIRRYHLHGRGRWSVVIEIRMKDILLDGDQFIDVDTTGETTGRFMLSMAAPEGFV